MGLAVQAFGDMGECLQSPRGRQVGADEFHSFAVTHQVDRSGIGSFDLNLSV
jgi:hypothetical protein